MAESNSFPDDMTEHSQESTGGRAFKQASPSGLVIDVASEIVRMQLALSNKVHVSNHDLNNLRKLPKGSGAILISNHDDEMD
ncbi:MAG: hypothetical protein K8F91_01045, partial [Candidatus Obscuribacterales bacterium]|nr:hypothetical protein [Candidatus Obscuribacterales bacterium]